MQEVNGCSKMCRWYKVESIIHSPEDQINKWKNRMNLWTKAMEIKLNLIIQSTKIYTSGLMRIWTYKCKLHQLYVTKERKNLNTLVSNMMMVWHGCENASDILGCIRQSILSTDRKTLLPFCNMLAGSYSKYSIQYYSSDNDEINLN